MANTTRILYSTTAGNTPSSLVSGQIAINEADGKLFYRATGGTVTQFASGGSSYTLPAATTTTLGGVSVGNGLSVTAGGTVSQRLGGYASNVLFG